MTSIMTAGSISSIFHGGLIHLIPQEHSLFRGIGNGKFVDVSREAGPVLDVKTVAAAPASPTTITTARWTPSS